MQLHVPVIEYAKASGPKQKKTASLFTNPNAKYAWASGIWRFNFFKKERYNCVVNRKKRKNA